MGLGLFCCLFWGGLGTNSILALYIFVVFAGEVRWAPQPVIVTIRDNKDSIRVLLYSYYTTSTGWGS